MTLETLGFHSQMVDAMRRLVAAVPTFQALVGVTTEAEALFHTLFGGIWDSDEAIGSRALVRVAEGSSFEWESNSGFSFNGQLVVGFEFPAPYTRDDAFSEALQWMLNLDGEIVGKMLQLCRERTSEFPNITSANETIMPGIYEPTEQDGKIVGVTEWAFTVVGSLQWS